MRLIDADALIKTIGSHCYPVRQENNSIEPGMTRIGILQAIQEQPTIESERKKGKWIAFPNHMAYKCSECGRVIQTTDGRRNVSKHYPFCHCGARMEVLSDE